MAPKGTVEPCHGFDDQKDADALRRAMKGLGTDEKTIWSILPARTNAQRQQIALSYKTQFGRDLVEDLKSEISGTFQSLMVALMTPSTLYDASELRHAIKGLGTRENVLIEILASRTCAEVKHIKEVYKKEYDADLECDITGDTSGYFERLLVVLVQCYTECSTVAHGKLAVQAYRFLDESLNCKANRDPEGRVDDAKVDQDAQDLFKAGETKWGTDEEKFITIMGTRCHAHLRKVFDKYMTISGYQIEETIDSECSGHLEKLMLAVAKSVRSIPGYLADVLHHAMKGAGTDEATLIRVMVARSEIDLHDIRQMFRKHYGASLHDKIQSETSGDFQHSLLQLCGGNDA